MNYYKSVAKVLSIAFLFIASSCNIEPFEGDIPEEIEDTLPSSCEEAAINTGNAALAFGAVSTTDSNYSTLCSVYKKALEDQVSVCGDTGGAFQALIDSIGDCGEDDGEISTPEVADGHAFMTANLKGDQYNDLKPSGYFFNKQAVFLDDFFVEGEDVNYLKIQGGTNVFLINNLTEINLYIPENFWGAGTYDLNIEPRSYDSDSKETPTPYVSLVLTEEGGLNYNQLKGGKITITEFNLTERVIKGTFEFSFSEVSGNTPGTTIFQCKNGTFDYSLDHEFFD